MNTKTQLTKVNSIPVRVLQEWLARHSRGDERRIQESTKLSRPTISKALNHGFATYETILKISNYYSVKKPMVAKDIESEALKILNNEA